MAVYKVPQDVEADDKLLGPFSFRQFIFLIIAAMALGLAYGLSQLLLPLAVIPLPIAIFFTILALPIRKDQPMEIYMAAVISFILKPKVRLWKPDGIETLIEVIAPKTEDKQYGKGYTQDEVQRRLSYLANLVDSRGWSVRGVNEPDNSMREDLYNEAQQIDDLLDDQGSRAQKINDLLERQDSQRRQQIIDRMQQPQAAPQSVYTTPVAQPAPTPQIQPDPIVDQPTFDYSQPMVSPLYTPMSVVQPETPEDDIKLVVNPYPNMNQGMIMPLSEQQPPTQPVPTQQSDYTAPATQPAPNHQPEPTTSVTSVSPAIIDLANNHDGLSVETLQREAKRLKEKEQESDEVVISLR